MYGFYGQGFIYADWNQEKAAVYPTVFVKVEGRDKKRVRVTHKEIRKKELRKHNLLLSNKQITFFFFLSLYFYPSFCVCV